MLSHTRHKANKLYIKLDTKCKGCYTNRQFWRSLKKGLRWIRKAENSAF